MIKRKAATLSRLCVEKGHDKKKSSRRFSLWEKLARRCCGETDEGDTLQTPHVTTLRRD